ncbi:Transforming protein RhoA like protein [Argiope bruennichi]|uniref:Transforming protein RhoA like protein n=2 Tax=Argiope bruennichi TaxID=94029 RepID=A0A8T0EL98_ARGBR|nr:Transforming protein RhoA like protein [Argiope bruennichi]
MIRVPRIWLFGISRSFSKCRHPAEQLKTAENFATEGMHKIFPKKMRAPRNLKFTVVGDKAVGKTCLLKTYVYGTFPPGPYVSTVFPYVEDEEYVYSKTVDYSGTSLLLAMWDRVYSIKEDDSLRSLQYDKTDVFLLCFSVEDKTSFENVWKIWQREIKKFCCQTYCLLVGLKKDSNPCVTRSMGRDMAHKIGAVSYVECSAKTNDGLKHVFEVAVQTAMGCPPSPPINKKKNKLCESRLRRLIKLL